MAAIPDVKTENPVRLIKKYPNRRLYDTKTSSYITLADVKEMVLGSRRSSRWWTRRAGDDLTRAILLQIILEEESGGVPMFSSDLLSQMIRYYGNAMQGLMGSYLERTSIAFQRDAEGAAGPVAAHLRRQLARLQELWAQFMNLQGPAMQSLMQAYMEQSQKMFGSSRTRCRTRRATCSRASPSPASRRSPRASPSPTPSSA